MGKTEEESKGAPLPDPCFPAACPLPSLLTVELTHCVQHPLPGRGKGFLSVLCVDAGMYPEQCLVYSTCVSVE